MSELEDNFRARWQKWLHLLKAERKELFPMLFDAEKPEDSAVSTFQRYVAQGASKSETNRKHREKFFKAFCAHPNFEKAFPGGPLTEVEMESLPESVQSKRRQAHNKRNLIEVLSVAAQPTADLSLGIGSDELRGYFESLDQRHIFADNMRNSLLAFELTQGLARGYEITANWASAEYNYGILVLEAERLSDAQAMAEALVRRGIACYRLNRHKDAQDYLSQALAILDGRFNGMFMRLAAEARDYRAMALFRENPANAADALTQLQENENAWNTLGAPLLCAAWEHRLSIVLLALGNRAEAEQRVLSSLKKRRDAQAPSEVARSLAVLATIHREQNELLQSKLILMLAYRIQTAQKDLAGLARTFFELGALHLLMSPRYGGVASARRTEDTAPSVCDFNNSEQFPNAVERELLTALTKNENYRARSKPVSHSGWEVNAEWYLNKCRKVAMEIGNAELARRAADQLEVLVGLAKPAPSSEPPQEMISRGGR